MTGGRGYYICGPNRTSETRLASAFTQAIKMNPVGDILRLLVPSNSKVQESETCSVQCLISMVEMSINDNLAREIAWPQQLQWINSRSEPRHADNSSIASSLSCLFRISRAMAITSHQGESAGAVSVKLTTGSTWRAGVEDGQMQERLAGG